jgi:hypothetical protein
MRNLTDAELMDIAGGELNCSAGIPSGVSCSGSLSDWKKAYDSVVNAVTDAMCAATGKC